jgi:polar amino acid transport system permease protein
VAGNFDFTPYFATALMFVIITIPLARLTDWLVARERRRREAGAVL